MSCRTENENDVSQLTRQNDVGTQYTAQNDLVKGLDVVSNRIQFIIGSCGETWVKGTGYIAAVDVQPHCEFYRIDNYVVEYGNITPHLNESQEFWVHEGEVVPMSEPPM